MVLLIWVKGLFIFSWYVGLFSYIYIIFYKDNLEGLLYKLLPNYEVGIMIFIIVFMCVVNLNTVLYKSEQLVLSVSVCVFFFFNVDEVIILIFKYLFFFILTVGKVYFYILNVIIYYNL